MSVVPSPQFTVVVAIAPSESEAEIVMTIADPDVAVVDLDEASRFRSPAARLRTREAS